MKEYQKYQEALDRIGSDATNYHLSFSTLSSVIISQEKETMADRELLQELVDKETPLPVDKKTVNIFVVNNLYNESWEGYCLRCNSIVKKDFNETIVANPSINDQESFALIAKQADKSKYYNQTA